MNSNGANDWYLPATTELKLIYDNLVDVDGDSDYNTPTPGMPYNFQLNRYFSSSENDANSAFGRDFVTGAGTDIGKERTDRQTRCVRKGPAPRCVNPYGLEGDMTYNTTHDVMQYCDGARWRAIGK